MFPTKFKVIFIFRGFLNYLQRPSLQSISLHSGQGSSLSSSSNILGKFSLEEFCKVSLILGEPNEIKLPPRLF